MNTPLAVAAATALLAGSAHATVVRITAEGTVATSNIGAFTVGQDMTMVFEYESVSPRQRVISRQAFYIDALKSISFESGAWDTSDTGDFGQINKYDNLSNTDGIQFQVAAVASTYQHTNPKPDTVDLADIGGSVFSNVFINFASFSENVWHDYSLPESYNFNSFDQTQNALFAFSDGVFSVGWNEVRADVIPAPATGALFGVASVIGLRRRR